MTARLTDKFGALVKSIEALEGGHATEHKIELAMRRVGGARVAEIEPYLEAIRQVDQFFDGLHAQLAAIQVRNNQ